MSGSTAPPCVGRPNFAWPPAHGIAALGLATEVAKLSDTERRSVIEWVAEDTAGGCRWASRSRAPRWPSRLRCYARPRRPGQAGRSFSRLLWGHTGRLRYIRFFGRVADAARISVGIQNAPAYMGRGLSAADFLELTRRHPNICLLKGEAPATEIAEVIALTQGRIPVFNGRGGLELTDNLRAGCAGLILAPERSIMPCACMSCSATAMNLAAELGYRDAAGDRVCHGSRWKP